MKRRITPMRTTAALALLAALSVLPATATAAGAKGDKHSGRQQTHNEHKPQKAQKKHRGLYWGAWIGDQLTGTEAPFDMSAVARFEESVHKGLSLIEFSAPFTDCSDGPCSYYPFPTEQMQKIRAYGAIPVFSWNSASSHGDPVDPNFQLADLIGGAYDRYIASFATQARDWGHPFFLRFNWEMNGNWFPWAEDANGNSKGEYVAAWRHVHDIFTAVGATNATWVWCPYSDPQGRLRPIGGLYPGDNYVDWTCLDGFNWGRNSVNPQPWRNFDQLFAGPYRQIVKRIAPGKPMLLAELASNGGGRAKAKWLHRMFKRIATRYRRIRGLIWFDQVDRGVNWPIETSRASAKIFSKGVRRHPYRGNRYAELSGGAIRPPR